MILGKRATWDINPPVNNRLGENEIFQPLSKHCSDRRMYDWLKDICIKALKVQAANLGANRVFVLNRNIE